MFGPTAEAQLNVDASHEDLAETTLAWFDGWARALAADGLEELADHPAKVGAASARPGELFGVLTLHRERQTGPARVIERNASKAGFAWLRAELADPPGKAQIWLGRTDDMGHRSGWLLSAEAAWLETSPGWLALQTTVDSSTFEPAVQRAWLAEFLAQAERSDPGYGQLGYYHSNRATALEDCLDNRQHPARERDPEYTIGASREILRGYSWVTVVPRELVSRLDDGALAAAFVDIRPLKSGALWLRATEDFREYDEAAAGRVFTALAPVLRRGLPMRRREFFGQAPYLLAYEDAAAYQSDPA